MLSRKPWEAAVHAATGLWARPQRLEGCRGLVGSQGHLVSGSLVGPLSEQWTLRSHFEHDPYDNIITFIIHNMQIIIVSKKENQAVKMFFNLVKLYQKIIYKYGTY